MSKFSELFPPFPKYQKHPLWYVYPLHHVVSFTLVGKRHIEQLKRRYKVEEVGETSVFEIYPYSKPVVIIHPLIYAAGDKLEKLVYFSSMCQSVLGVEVADSDMISNQAVAVANSVNAIILPSKFAEEAYRRSGVAVPIHVVPHGVPSEFLRGKREPADGNLKLLKKLKDEKKYVYLLYFLWHCYDEQTRALTKKGFKYWWELTPDDEIATVNLQTGELEYQKPEKIYTYDYDGDLIHFHGQHYDLLVTPNHRMVVRKTINSFAPYMRDRFKKGVVDPLRSWEFLNAEEIYRSGKHRDYEILRICEWKGKSMEWFELPDLELDSKYPKWAINSLHNKPRYVKKVPIRPFLRFLGWWISEGYTQYHKYNQQYLVILCNTNREYIEEMMKAVREMGFHPVLSKKKPRSNERELYYVYISSKQLYMTLKMLGLPVYSTKKGKKSRLKFVPDFIKELAPDLIMEFLTVLWKGDGTFMKNGEFLKYTTTSKRLAEDVGELLLKCGYAVAIHKDKKRKIYDVCPSKVYSTPSIRNSPEKVHYKGKIWSVTVPNGNLIVERNGKIVVSGNSGFRKGADLVKKAVDEIQKSRENVVLVMVSFFNNPSINIAFQENKVVNITGFLEDPNKVDLYDICDIYLLFSRGGGFEINGLEALSRGEIVIAPDAGAWTEYLPPEFLVKTARWVRVFPDNPYHIGNGPEIDVDKAIDRILFVIDNLDSWKERAESYAKTIRQQYSWDSVGEKLIKVVSQYVE